MPNNTESDNIKFTSYNDTDEILGNSLSHFVQDVNGT